jgi:hypothetical protein
MGHHPVDVRRLDAIRVIPAKAVDRQQDQDWLAGPAAGDPDHQDQQQRCDDEVPATHGEPIL